MLQTKSDFKHRVMHFFIAVLIGYSIAVFCNSALVMRELYLIDVPFELNDIFRMILGDWLGLLPGYGTVILITASLSLLLSVIANRKFSSPPQLNWIFWLFGFAMMILAMKPLLGVTLITSARSTLGFALQCGAGAIAGMTFYALSRVK